MPAEPLWRVEIVGGCGDTGTSEGCEWHAVKSMVRLIHVTTGQALKMSQKQLPKWGFHQHEVVTDRVHVQDDTVWNVEEHRYTKSKKNPLPPARGCGSKEKGVNTFRLNR